MDDSIAVIQELINRHSIAAIVVEPGNEDDFMPIADLRDACCQELRRGNDETSFAENGTKSSRVTDGPALFWLLRFA